MSTDELVIHNARLIDPATGRDAMGWLRMADKKIVDGALGPPPASNLPHLDAQGNILMPGAVDAAVHIPRAGLLHKELQAAASAGVTTVVCWPDTQPLLDAPGLVEMLLARAQPQPQAQPHAQMVPLGALTQGLQGKALSEMLALSEAGCVGFSQGDIPVADTQVLLRALQYAASHGLAVWMQPRDVWLGQGVAASGALSLRMGLAGVPDAAETVALFTLLELVRLTQCRVHLCRISAAASVALVRHAKTQGLPITCDIDVHHLHLCEDDLGHYDSRLFMQPPLRTAHDRQALRQALADGTIDILVSDHRPLPPDAKNLPWAQSSPGASAVELLLGLCLRWAEEEAIPLPQALTRITCAPAQLLGLGCSLEPGMPANLCLWDPSAYRALDAKNFLSEGKISPFASDRGVCDLPGKVLATWVEGRQAWPLRPHPIIKAR